MLSFYVFSHERRKDLQLYAKCVLGITSYNELTRYSLNHKYPLRWVWNQIFTGITYVISEFFNRVNVERCKNKILV